MDSSQLRIKYKNETTICLNEIERLEIEIKQIREIMTEVRNEYLKAIENLGLKEGAKVKITFPDDGVEVFGYIHRIEIFETGNVELFVSLPSEKTGKRLKRVKDFYTGVKLEWVTVLPDNYNFGEG